MTVILHIYFTILLAIENRRARPEAYRDQKLRQSDLGFAPHGRERAGRARVHHFSPAHFTFRAIRSAVSACSNSIRSIVTMSIR